MGAKRRIFGTVLLRSRVFYIRFRDAAGRKVTERAGATRAIALRLLGERQREVETEKATGERPVDPITFAALMQRYESLFRGTRKEPVLLRDRDYLRATALPTFGPMEVHRIRQGDVERFLVKRTEEARIAPGTRNRECSRLSVLFKAAVRLGHARVNPCAGIPRAKEPRIETPFLDVPQQDALLAEVPEPLRFLALLLVDSGLRLGEALRLTWKDADLAARRLAIRESKTGCPRTVSYTSRGAAALEAMAARRAANPGILSATIFGALGTVNPWGEPVLRHDKRLEWKAATKRAKLPGLRLHDLRHVAASTMVRAGVPIGDVAAVLGHLSLTMVSQRYGRHVPANATDLAAERLERFHAAEEAKRRALAQ